MSFGNRRKRRPDYLLDVKVHREGRLRERARLSGAILAALLVIGLGGYGLYLVTRFVANRLVFDNPRFCVMRIVVESEGALSPARVAQLAGVRLGQNLFALDLRQVQRNLEMVSLVKGAEVRRLLPNQLMIHVDERVPVAQLRMPAAELKDSQFLVDRSGVVMKPLRLADGTVIQPQTAGPIPVLTGVKLMDLRVGHKVESDQIFSALDLLDHWAQSPVASILQIDAVDLGKPRQLIVRTRQGPVVQVDTEDFAPQLRRLGVILAWSQQRQKQIQTVDLTVARNVPVQFLNAL
jgi:cell division protein FtsQ